MNKLYRILNVEPGEEKRVSLLLIQSFFLGIYLATFDISTSALFKKTFPDPDWLAWSFVVSGGAGIILSWIYIRLQKSWNFAKLSVTNLIFIAITTLLSWVGFLLSDNRWVVFSVFVMMGPLNGMAIVGFSGVAGRLFTLRQAKRLFGLIDSGQTFGIILISFLVPVLLFFMENTDVLIVSIFSIVGTLIVQFLIVRRFKREMVLRKRKKNEDRTIKYSELFSNKYFKNISLFALVSSIAAFLIYFSFMNVSSENYPDDKDLASFFGLFFGVVNIFSFLIQAFVFSRLTNMYGIKVSLLLLPIIVGIFVAGSALMGTFFGYSSESANFMLFFLLISLSRLFSQSLRSALEKPAQKILYQPIDVSIRYDVQAKIDGSVNEFSSILAGVLILGLIMVGLQSIYATYATFVIIVLLALIIFRLYVQYQRTLRSSLKFEGDEEEDSFFSEGDNVDVIYEGVNSQHPDKVIYTLKVTEFIEPLLYEELISSLLNDSSPSIREFALGRIVELRLYNAIEILQKRLEVEDSPELLDKTAQVLDRLYLSQEESINYDHIELLTSSRDSEKRAYAAKVLGQIVTQETLPLLTDLIRDIEPKVRLQAIKSAAKVHRAELWPFLTDNLSNPLYQSAATSSLISLGEEVLDTLDRSFYKSGATTEQLVKIVRITGLIGGDKAMDLLLHKITYPDALVVKQVLLSLRNCGFQATQNEFNRVFQAIETTCGNILWNLAALEQLEAEDFPHLKIAFQEENKDNYDALYLLLALLYDPASINKIRENIDTGTSESIGYAVELLELFVAEEIKVILFPLLEDIPVQEKIRQLQNYFPHVRVSISELLLQIINRDYNQISRWTKACAMVAYANQPGATVGNDLIANLFNPDQLMKEVAGTVIFQLDPKLYHQVGKRIPSAEKRALDQLIVSSKSKKIHRLIEKAHFLRTIPVLKDVRWNVLSAFARELDLQTAEAGEVLLTKNQLAASPLYFLIDGAVALKGSEGNLHVFDEPCVLGDMLFLESDDPEVRIEATMATRMYMIPRNKLFEVLYQHKEITQVVIDTIHERFDSPPVVKEPDELLKGEK